MEFIHSKIKKKSFQTTGRMWLEIFNKCFDSGKFSSSRRIGKILPIPKLNSRIIQVEKFRPITLLPVIGEIFEKIMAQRLTELCEQNGLLPKFQNGFRIGKSTLDNLIVIQQEIHGAFMKREYMIAVFLDIKKAYDCINRLKLYKFLKYKGLKGKMGEWLKEFLLEPRKKYCNI